MATEPMNAAADSGLGSVPGRPVLVVGAGVSGRSAASALAELGAEVVVSNATAEQIEQLPAGVTGCAELTEPPAGTELVVTSPGLRPSDPLLTAARRAGIEVIGEPELAWRWTRPGGPGADAGTPRWLVVTGTNGKTTTVGMLESILRADGRNAVACGNIGYPVIDAVRAGYRDLAVELSSFQLHWSSTIRPAAGCLLNVAEDHLDWHGGMAGYVAAKARALRGAVAVVGVDDPALVAVLDAAPAPRRVGITLGAPTEGQLGVLDEFLVDRAFGVDPIRLLAADEIRPYGPPGWLDALAASALARAAGVSAERVADGLRAFHPGPHRGALVGERDGVRFIDDSKATNPHAAAAALAGHRRVVWIAGGLLKGASVTELILQHANRLAGVVLMGTDRAMFSDALLRHAADVPVLEVPPGEHEPMIDAVKKAAGLAAPGDVVLLAPAAASLDQFPSYAARGQAFAAAVTQLTADAR
jgi:UDP-N-acetylmuramoylalanine--D-glutamate ligase